MPIIRLEKTGPIDPEKKEEWIKEVIEATSRILECPIDVVTGSIVELPMENMFMGNMSWGKRIDKEK